jgi:hypothetical protein
VKIPRPLAFTFLRASRAGDAALDLGGEALRAESDRGSALMSVSIPGRSRASSLSTQVKGRAWRHRLLRTPGMSTLVTLPRSLKPPEMLDEPTAQYSSYLSSAAPI